MSKEIKGEKYGRHYLESFKKSIVAEIEREGHAIKMVCERHNLSVNTVHRWIDNYASSNYFESKRKRRSPAEKNKIIREIISGRSTIGEAQLKYQIDCRDTITLWLREYKKAQRELSAIPVETKAVTDQQPGGAEILKELEMARVKIRALEIMIDIAGDQFKVDIRKKFGAKQ
ncbi:transposase [Pedobacter africanus]|uniref:Transposase-like protein n=1 Tax=Pedobacter africanus TaxID=151894 RepID=A0ACC6KQU5_9SPHI|nr:transposase [Pedobacter africanus]MDR6781530.1 transposase-like protein [Pedobacter africanus]